MSNPDSTSTAVIAIVVVVYLVVAIALYVWVALALSRVFAKLGEPSWKGWVPFLNTATVYRLGGFSPLWLITLFFPVVQIAGIVVFYFAAHGINRRFGKTVGWTVLAVLLFPVWATILGFGTSTPIPVTDAAGSPFETRMAGLAPGLPPVAPVLTPPVLTPPVLTPSVSVPTVAVAPVAEPIFAAPDPAPVVPPVAPPTPPPAVEPVAPIAEAPLAEPIAEAPVDPKPVAESDVDPWAPPISSIPGMTVTATPPPAPAPFISAFTAAPPVAPPAAPPTPAATPAPVVPDPAPVVAAAPAPVEYPDDDKTVIKRRGPSFILEPVGGEPVTITGGAVLLGRNPNAGGDDLGSQLVALADPSKTMSKTHARLTLADGGWTITDLRSTNGTIVVDDAGTEVELEPGASASVTGSFKLGQLAVSIRQDG